MREVSAPPPLDADWADVRPVLDEEIGRLPDKLRTALVLCELEGLDRGEAAARLGVAAGTLSSRLARAKDALRRRLLRRGLTLSAMGLGAVLTQARAGTLPVEQVADAVAGSLEGAASPASVALADLEVRAMFWTKALTMGVLVLVLAFGAGGTTLAVRHLAADGGAEKKVADRDRLQGTWKVVSVKVGGKDPTEEIVGKTMTFGRDKVTVRSEATYTLDPARTPAHIDLVPLEGPENEKGKTFRGVYKLEKGKLTLHMAGPDEDRPTDFVSKEGEKTVLFVLERVKK